MFVYVCTSKLNMGLGSRRFVIIISLNKKKYCMMLKSAVLWVVLSGF